MSLPTVQVLRTTSSSPQPHHVTGQPTKAQSSLLSTWSLASRGGQKQKKEFATASEEKPSVLQGFQNPWPSWHKPTRQEVWNALEWGDDQDPCIKLAAQHQRAADGASRTPALLAKQLLQVQNPDFAFDANTERFKATWLGHAGMLLQLAPLQAGDRPFRCVFDPMFSMRSSPNQSTGPLRTYRPPCKVDDLPEIDVVMISHDHYDHLDYDTIMSIWKCNKSSVRFIVPLRNAAWFISCGIPEDRVIDLDWWESVHVDSSVSMPIEIICTPSQHNSGRGASPANSTLWSSWYIKYPSTKPVRAFFAGDTGFQFHDSLHWPPSPGNSKTASNDNENGTWPTCPAFEQITQRLGSPHLLMLPIAVGATFDYVRSFVPLPNSISPFPRHRPGVTAANHMPPWDAVRVLQLMTAGSDQAEAPIAVAMHWGTFVSDPVDILKTLGQLEHACRQHDMQFARSLEQVPQNRPVFLALDHGQSVSR